MRTPRPPISKRQRFRVLSRDGFRCTYCGQRPPAVVLHVDHVVSLVDGGSNDDANLVGAQTGNPRKLRLLGIVPCVSGRAGRDLEREVHQALSADHLRGEWFRFSPACREIVRRYLGAEHA